MKDGGIVKMRQQVSSLQSTFQRIEQDQRSVLEEQKKKIKLLANALGHITEHWAGTWASAEFDCYREYRNKRKQLIRVDANHIRAFVETKTSLKIGDIDKSISSLLDDTIEFHEELVTELSLIKTDQLLHDEVSLLETVENTPWGLSWEEFVRSEMPHTLIVRDTSALLNRGVEVPPHIMVMSQLKVLFSKVDSISKFNKMVKRLFRQLELKLPMSNTNADTSDFVIQIIEGFNSFAKQLQHRHNNRKPLIVADEYDVQDLLIALLKLGYEDVRKEEFTPSFGGSSTRMDILLKGEKIVVEVKMTRKGLKDAELGKQLTLDTAHYKGHADCQRLIYFVYDPGNFIRNPSGIEGDLTKRLSDETLKVEVYIRPRR